MSSKFFIAEKKFLVQADFEKYNFRLKEIGLQSLMIEQPSEYKIYHYEATWEDGRQKTWPSYWICKDTESYAEVCPNCGYVFKERDIKGVLESEPMHYRHIKDKVEPVKLYIRRIRWQCSKCKKTRMQDFSTLVYGNRHETETLRKFLGQQSLYMETMALAKTFGISDIAVQKFRVAEIERCDKARNWDDIRTLGLYTVKLFVSDEDKPSYAMTELFTSNEKSKEETKTKAKKKTGCCLCTDVDTDSVIDLFAWNDVNSRDNFLEALSNKQAINRILTSADKDAYEFAVSNFSNAEVMVDRVDIRKRLLDGMQTTKEGHKSDKNFPMLRRHWNLLDHVSPISTRDCSFVESVLSVFPDIKRAYELKEAGLKIYRTPEKNECEKRVTTWIKSEKYGILPYEQLAGDMETKIEPVVRFAEAYYGDKREPYETRLLEVYKPLIWYTDLICTQPSEEANRGIKFASIRGRIVYGIAMLANYYATLKSTDSINIMHFRTRLFNQESMVSGNKAEITLRNFRIPLKIYSKLLYSEIEDYHHQLNPNKKIEYFSEESEYVSEMIYQDKRFKLKPLRESCDREKERLQPPTDTQKGQKDTMSDKIAFDPLWDEAPIDVTQEVNFIWSIANKLRGSYMPDKYGDVIIPMTILRRLECALEPTKQAVLDKFAKDKNCPAKVIYRISEYQFYNASPYSLKELCNDPDNVAANFKVYIQGFSAEVQKIFNGLELFSHIDKMNKDGCLFNVVKAFADLDLAPETYDGIKMGYIFEHLIGKFYQNVDAGQFYTGRDIIKCLVALLISEGCDDIFDKGKVVTVCDQACGTGGMLSTAYSFIKHYNPSADVRLFGQEFMPQSYAVGLAEMMIKGQKIENFRNADTFKEDCFPNIKMRFVLENPPFGTPWAGNDAKDGQEDAVRAEYDRAKEAGNNSRWGAGLPSGGDSQLIFMQSAIDKMDDKVGRAAIIENGSPLFSGGTSSGESQIRRWILQKDLLEAIIALPTDLFYNTGIATYVWILSKNKRQERKGYVQLIDATSIYHKLRKAVGNKKNELLPEDRDRIVKLYTAFDRNQNDEYSKVFTNEEFMYREYTIMQPLQRSYAITEERIQQMLAGGTLTKLYDPAEVEKLEEKGTQMTAKERMKLETLYAMKGVYNGILSALRNAISDEIYLSPNAFMPVLRNVLANVTDDKKLLEKIADGLSEMDKNAEIQKDRKGNILYDKKTKDTELVPYTESIDDYMAREVLPHIPDAVASFEENLNGKKPVIKTGAEIPFTRYFYKYEQPTSSEELAARFTELEESVRERVAKLFE